MGAQGWGWWLLAWMVSGGVTFGAISFFAGVAPRIGLMDHPSGGRKLHETSTPLVGGISLLPGVLAGLLAAGAPSPFIFQVAGPVVILFIVAVADDRADLGALPRFLCQGLAILLMIRGGVLVESLGGLFSEQPVRLGDAAIAFTIFGCVGVINAINMIDGIDGLAGVLSLIALGGLGRFALLGGLRELALLALLLGAGLGAFLVHNLGLLGKRRRVFLGEAGSTLLGFLISFEIIALSQGPQAAMKPGIALWLLAVPLIDTVSTMCRRIVHGRSPFAPGRDHIHHILMDQGLSPRAALMTAGGAGLLLAVAAVAADAAGVAENRLFALFLVIFVIHFAVTSVLLSRRREGKTGSEA